MIPSLPSTAVIVTLTVTPSWLKPLHRWLCTFGPICNEGTRRTCEKKPKSTSRRRAQTPRVTWPRAPGKTLRQQRNLGRSPNLSRRHLTCITMPRRLSLWLHCPVTVSTRAKSRESQLGLLKAAGIFTPRTPFGGCSYPNYGGGARVHRFWAWMATAGSWWPWPCHRHPLH